jgi:hypothetical protein
LLLLSEYACDWPAAEKARTLGADAEKVFEFAALAAETGNSLHSDFAFQFLLLHSQDLQSRRWSELDPENGSGVVGASPQ